MKSPLTLSLIMPLVSIFSDNGVSTHLPGKTNAGDKVFRLPLPDFRPPSLPSSSVYKSISTRRRTGRVEEPGMQSFASRNRGRPKFLLTLHFYMPFYEKSSTLTRCNSKIPQPIDSKVVQLITRRDEPGLFQSAQRCMSTPCVKFDMCDDSNDADLLGSVSFWDLLLSDYIWGVYST
jgi:hypothetical protein